MYLIKLCVLVGIKLALQAQNALLRALKIDPTSGGCGLALTMFRAYCVAIVISHTGARVKILKLRIHDATGCTTGCKSVYTMERLDVGLHESNMLNSYNRLVQQENVCIHDAAGCTTGSTTGCIVYTGFIN